MEALFEAHGQDIAGVIVEPVAGNMGVVPPKPGFLEGLRALCDRYGALLIFDEVMTGFRVAPGGAQARYGVRPDITTLGKVIGGGLPVGAYGGPKDIMRYVAPAGPMYQAGTLSGNPLAMAAGIATLDALREPGVWETLEARTQRLAQGLAQAAEEAGVPVTVQHVGTMFTVFFLDRAPTTWEEVSQADTKRFARWFWEMAARGVYYPPSQYESAFMSLAHEEEHLERTLEAARDAFGAVSGEQ